MTMTPRHSERNKNKLSVDPSYDSEDALTEDDAPTELCKKSKPSKRRKVARNPVAPLTESEAKNSIQPEPQVGRPDRGHIRGRRGHLKQMTEMPLDTLHEIFRDLEPVDLLHLSWASKSLHAIVMEKSARYIWEGAFEKLYALRKSPPRCPEDLNLAQYARFLFKKQCMVCGVANGYWTSWGMRLRACWKCLTSNDRFVCYDDPRVAYYETFLIFIYAKGTRFCFKALYLEVSATPNASDFYQRKRIKIQGAEAYERWAKSCSDDRKEVLAQVKSERKTAILNKLAEIGWKESEIEEVTEGKVDRNLATSMRAKKLTDGEWKELQPTIVKHLEGLKEKRLAVLRERKLWGRWKAFRQQFRLWEGDQALDDTWNPHDMDLVFLEPFKSIIFTPSIEDTDFALDKIDCVAQEWIQKRDDFVLSLLPQDTQVMFKNKSEHSANETLLQPLAFLQFTGFDSKLFTLTGLCRDRHPPRSCGSRPDEDGDFDRMLYDIRTDGQPWFWTIHNFKFSIKASEVAKKVIKLFGLDEGTATILQMDLSRKEFVCLSCPPTSRPFGRGWRSMIQHEVNEHVHDDQTDGLLEERWSEMVLDKSQT